MPVESNVRGMAADPAEAAAEEDVSASAASALGGEAPASDLKWRHTREESEEVTDAPPTPSPTPASATSTPVPAQSNATSPSAANQGAAQQQQQQRHQAPSATPIHTLAARLPARTTADMSHDSSVGSSASRLAATAEGAGGRRSVDSASSPSADYLPPRSSSSNGHGTPTTTKLSGIGRKMDSLSINADDEDVQIAIAALGSMKNMDSPAHSRATTYETGAGGIGSEGEGGGSMEFDAQMDTTSSSSYPHHYQTATTAAGTDAASSSGHSSLLHTGGAPSSASSNSTATHYTTQASTASGGGARAQQTQQQQQGNAYKPSLSSLHNRKKGKGKDSTAFPAGVASSNNFPDHSDDSVHSASASASASIMGSTASAIVHDEDGNPVRIELDSSDMHNLMLDGDGESEGDFQGADFEERRAALEGEGDEQAFLQRFGRLPIVRGTLRAYELGKRKSRVVKVRGIPSPTRRTFVD